MDNGVQGDGTLARWVCLAQIVAWSMGSRRIQLTLILLTMAVGSWGLATTYFVGQSAQERLWADLDLLMGSHVRVLAYAGPDDILQRYRPSPQLTMADLAYVREHVVGARYVAPMLVTRANVEHGDARMIMMIDGISPELENEPSYQPTKGTRLSDAARNAMVFECYLTAVAAEYLSIDMDQDATIRVGSYRFRVRGIIRDPMEADGPYRFRVAVPYALSQVLWGNRDDIGTMLVAWHTPRDMEAIVGALRKALDECRAPNAYVLSSSQFTIQKRKSIVSNFMLFGAIQAFFCVLVAAIGIVNVMLANVVRRAREFAIRVAMGARYRDLAIIVLAESVMLGLLGALTGIGGAILASPALCRTFAARIEEASQLEPYFCMQGVVVPLVVCTLAGLAAGIVPALKARRLDILRVLRAE